MVARMFGWICGRKGCLAVLLYGCVCIMYEWNTYTLHLPTLKWHTDRLTYIFSHRHTTHSSTRNFHPFHPFFLIPVIVGWRTVDCSMDFVNLSSFFEALKYTVQVSQWRPRRHRWYKDDTPGRKFNFHVNPRWKKILRDSKYQQGVPVKFGPFTEETSLEKKSFTASLGQGVLNATSVA